MQFFVLFFPYNKQHAITLSGLQSSEWAQTFLKSIVFQNQNKRSYIKKMLFWTVYLCWTTA